MAKKKDKGGGGGGKKAGKASKLAKMNEQERVKYLERKMAEEEEVKRRKEEMVSVFMKMKLGREEKKSKLNTSKLIDFWRTKRRVVKTVELEQDVTTLKDAFERALVKKNRLIELLLQGITAVCFDFSIESAVCFESRRGKSAVCFDSRRRNQLFVLNFQI